MRWLIAGLALAALAPAAGGAAPLAHREPRAQPDRARLRRRRRQHARRHRRVQRLSRTRRAPCRGSATPGASIPSACWNSGRTWCSRGRPARRATPSPGSSRWGCASCPSRPIASRTWRRRCARSAGSPAPRSWPTRRPRPSTPRSAACAPSTRACRRSACSSRSTTSRSIPSTAGTSSARWSSSAAGATCSRTCRSSRRRWRSRRCSRAIRR